jgi:glycosyltransferase involved in cell wall biosynthesis
MFATGFVMRVAYIASGSPFTPQSWSGIPYFSLRALESRISDLHVIDTPRLDRQVRRLAGLDKFGVQPMREPLLTRAYSDLLSRELELIQPRVILAVGAIHKVAWLDPKWPLVCMDDATFASLEDYYPNYSVIGPRARRLGHALQKTTYERARRLLMTSQWAADSAAVDYGVPDSRLRVIPMGANLETDPGDPDPVKPEGPLKFLFVGYDWPRKGGEVIVSVFRELRNLTGDAELHIVGCEPRETLGVEGVIRHGRLNKSNPRQRDRLNALYRSSTFFFMPSRAEAYGLVYCEACAFGLPSIATRTGGVATIITDGKTGVLMDLDATVAAYVDRIMALWRNTEARQAMSLAARKDYEIRLNWGAWSRAVADEIDKVAAPRSRRPNGLSAL